MKAIMCIFFLPFWLLKLAIACVGSVLLIIICAIALTFSGNVEEIKDGFNLMWRWAWEYSPFYM